MAKRRYTFVDFTAQPPVQKFIKMGAWDMRPVDTTRPAAYPGIGCFWLGQNYFEYSAALDNNNVAFNSNTPASGWIIPLQGGLDTAGIEITQGITSGQGQNQFVTGTDAFFIQCVFYITTRASIDHLQVGFRKLGSYAAASAEPTSIDTAYDDLAVMGIRAIDGALYSNTRQTGGVAVTTHASHANAADTSWLAMRIDVSAAGTCTYKIGTSAATQVAAIAALATDLLLVPVTYTFTAGLTVIPCIVEGGSGTGTPDIGITQYICGVS